MASFARAGELAVGKGRARRKRALTEEQEAEVAEAFTLFDANKDGKLDYYQLKVAMRALGIEVKKREVLQILKEYDISNEGLIDQRGFREVVTDRILERNPIEEVMKAFALFDDDKTGKITLKNMRRAARELGEEMTDEELQAMIDEFDSSKSGELNEDDFLSIMTSDFS
eukprot:m.340634 g.340634  ORF g.340634 m.340634 type:complete len:170 (+) comp19432_c0_seq1:258-767(+)